MAKKVRAGKSIKTAVGILEGASDPSRGEAGNPVKKRSTFTSQIITGKGHHGSTAWNGLLSGTQTGASGSVSVDGVLTTAQDSIRLGDFDLIEGIHWTITGMANTTADNIATAISNLEGFTAEVNGGIDTQVDVTGPVGPSKVEMKLVTRSGNLTVSPADGYMSHGGPSIGAPDIT